MAQFLDFQASTKLIAIENYIAAKFGRWDENDQYIEPDVEVVRIWALGIAGRLAAERENELDILVSGNFVRAIMANTEIVDYVNSGRPASPQASRYVIADAMADRRGIALRDMLEALFAHWRNIQGRIATIITELDRATEAIEAATTIEEITGILAGLNWG